jgi:hypothetical protein
VWQAGKGGQAISVNTALENALLCMPSRLVALTANGQAMPAHSHFSLESGAAIEPQLKCLLCWSHVHTAHSAATSYSHRKNDSSRVDMQQTLQGAATLLFRACRQPHAQLQMTKPTAPPAAAAAAAALTPA